MGQVFVRASSRARAYVRTSKLSKASTLLGLPKVRLAESHAFRQFKTAQNRYNEVGGAGNFAKMQRKQLRHSKLMKIRRAQFPNVR
jgi:hypothetical protein